MAEKKYSSKASEKVEKTIKEMKAGKLTIGRSKKKVTSIKQAVAIGIDEARRKGLKVPKEKKN
jgi:hypothetical protein